MGFGVERTQGVGPLTRSAASVKCGCAAICRYSCINPESRSHRPCRPWNDGSPSPTKTRPLVLADGKLYVFDLTTRMIVDSVLTAGNPRYIGFDAGGRTAVIPNEAGWVNFLR